MKKVLIVFGTRPESIKLAPVIKELKKYSDKINLIVCVTPQHRLMLDQVLDQVPISPNDTIIEVGCGDGWISSLLADRLGCTVIGFDFNPNRILSRKDPRVLIAAGDASLPPIADHQADVVLSFAVLEHLPNREKILRNLIRLVKPNGIMIHIVPTSIMKILQWGGHVPDLVRKQLRGTTRFLAGQRVTKPKKYHRGQETNNPNRPYRHRGVRKLLPRVHGEYNTNIQELVENSDRHWQDVFQKAGLKTLSAIPLGAFSPYAFGFSGFAKRSSMIGLASVRAYILTPSTS